MDKAEQAKKNIGEKAASLVQDGMIVGLGSGSTAAFFIDSLIKRFKEGLSITVVSSSKESLERAKEGNIKTYTLNEVDKIDLTIDGADEIDPEKRMIKGGGGCHLQEKILAYNSKEMIVMVDESKLSKKLGTKKLPIEILYYGAVLTEKKLREMGYKGFFRKVKDGTLFFTENANLIYDIEFDNPIEDPEKVQTEILRVPGVLETGLFLGLANKVIVGYFDGQIKILD